MFKEAIVWALLITSIVFCYHAIESLLPVKTAKTAKLVLSLLFWFTFSCIYLVFRFFWWIDHVTRFIQ